MSLTQAQNVIEKLLDLGVEEFCISSGKRNAFFIKLLSMSPSVKVYDWFEERSSAFFALGRSRESKKPVVIMTTSGTAAGELLPAAMEAYYTGVPLILVTSDRPKRFRGTGAPQSAEQKGLYGVYTPLSVDIEEGEPLNLEGWDRQTPLHLNICFEEPSPSKIVMDEPYLKSPGNFMIPQKPPFSLDKFQSFVNKTKYPLVVVSTLPQDVQDDVVDLLQKMRAPVYCEGISGIREREELTPYQITRIENLWKIAEERDYPLDGILRIGGVPTFRPWRDLEEMEGKIELYSVSSVPFSGVSWGDVEVASLKEFAAKAKEVSFPSYSISSLKEWDDQAEEDVAALLKKYDRSEPGMFHTLSKMIPQDAHVYLGNSLPIREWDLASSRDSNRRRITANRGVNGIDGQLSTFLGECSPHQENWAIIGDLTAMYDMAAPWVLSAMQEIKVNIVVVNNSGGRFFARLFKEEVFQNPHPYQFEGLAKMWGLNYSKWETIPHDHPSGNHQLIELVPNNADSEKFWNELKTVCTSIPASSTI